MNTKTKENVLFIVRALPFEAAGTPVVIRSLLTNLPDEGYYVLGRRPHPGRQLPNDVRQKMFQIPILYTRGHRFWKYFSILPGFFMGLWIIKKYKITKLVGVFQDDASLALAYLLALVFPRIDFYPYLMDLYAEQEVDHKLKRVQKIQEKIFKRAKKVLVVNDGMKDFLVPRYPLIQFESIPIISQLRKINQKLKDKNLSKPFVLIFSGSVNEDRLEPLQIMAKVIAEDKRFLLRFLTSQSEENLRSLGVFYDGFQLKYCITPEELMQELNQGDLLYLPLKFTFPESKKAQMMTCFGAKVFDYMLASVPMLIHAPNYVYNYTFLKEHNAAFLLDTLNEVKIQTALQYLLIEAKSEAGNNKFIQANQIAKLFNGDNVSQKFILTLNLGV